jgi:hypothetical protein
MTNFEFYKEKLQEVGSIDFGIMKDTKELVRCRSMCCSNCLFHDHLNDTNTCGELELEFLYAEHKEQPKLTKRERAFCEFVETGYIARDSESWDNDLYYYVNKPNRKSESWDYIGSDLLSFNEMNQIKQISEMFKFITWEDEEPWSIEDLLKLEVIEE